MQKLFAHKKHRISISCKTPRYAIGFSSLSSLSILRGTQRYLTENIWLETFYNFFAFSFLRNTFVEYRTTTTFRQNTFSSILDLKYSISLGCNNIVPIGSCLNNSGLIQILSSLLHELIKNQFSHHIPYQLCRTE